MTSFNPVVIRSWILTADLCFGQASLLGHPVGFNPVVIRSWILTRMNQYCGALDDVKFQSRCHPVMDSDE